MAKMNLKLMNALRATLNRVATLHPGYMLVYGVNRYSRKGVLDDPQGGTHKIF